MKKILISLIIAFLICSCSQSVWVEELGDKFKENIEVFFATTEVIVSNNSVQSVVEVAFSAKENGEILAAEDELESGYYVFIAEAGAQLEFSVSNLPESFEVIWKDDLGSILKEGTSYSFDLVDIESNIHVLILNNAGNAENALKFKVIESGVYL